MAKNFSVALSLLLNSSQYTQGLRGAANATQSFRSQILGAFAPIAGIAALGASIKEMVGTIFEQTKKLDSLSAGYRAVITNSGDLKKVYAELNEMADRNGLSVNVLKTEYLGFAAASKGTALEGAKAMKIFQALTSSMGKLGASEEATHRALVAVTQMMSKGTVASEELRGQLGEALPGAFNMAARAMGVTTQELGKMLKDGDVLASEMLPKLAEELEKTFGGSYKIDTLTAAQGRFQTAITETIDKLSAGDLFKGIVNAGTAFIKVIGGTAKASDQFNPMIQQMNKLVQVVELLGAAFVVTFGFKKVTGFFNTWISANKQGWATATTQIAAANSQIKTYSSNIALLQRQQKHGWTVLTPTGTLTGATLDPLIAQQRQEQAAARTAISTARATRNVAILNAVWATFSPLIITAALALGAFLIVQSGVINGLKTWYDGLTGTNNALKEFNNNLNQQQFQAGLLFSELKNVEEGSKRYNEILGILSSKYPEIIKFYTDSEKGLLSIKDAQEAVNAAILKEATAKAIAKRQEEIGVTYASSVAPDSQKILDKAGVDGNAEKTNNVKLLIEDLKAGNIAVNEFVKKIYEISDKANIAWILNLATDIVNAGVRANTELDKLKRAIPEALGNGLSAEEVTTSIKSVDDSIKAIAELKAAEKDASTKNAKEAYDKELEALTKANNVQQTYQTQLLADRKITKKEFDEVEIISTLKYYEKQLALLKKYGKDSSALELQIAQERLKYSDLDLNGSAQFLKRKYTPLATTALSNDLKDTPNIKVPELTEKQKKRIKREGEMQGTAFGNAFNEGLANMTVDIGANLGERIGQSIAGSEDAWKGFGNDILKMIGTFLIQLGTALITYGVLMEAFKNSPPLVKIAVGAAAIIAGGILLGIAAGGSNIGSSGSTSSSSGGGSYSSPNTQAQDNKVVFEIQGSKLVGVLNNVDKRNNNFK